MSSPTEKELRSTLLEYIKRFALGDLDFFIQQSLQSGRELCLEMFYCPITIQPSALGNNCEHALYSSPMLVHDICRNIVKYLLKVKYGIVLETNQIILHIVIKQQTHVLGAYFNLTSVKGILTEYKFFKETFVRASVWVCSGYQCPIEFLQHLPSSECVECPNCSLLMTEMEEYRKYGTSAEGQILLRDSERVFDQNRTSKAINFMIEDERIPELELGVEYVMTGMWRGDFHFEVWGCHRVEGGLLRVPPIPSLEVLRKSSEKEPFAFTKCLSLAIGAEKYMSRDFPNFRTYLLLSLASVKSAYPIPVLVVCDNEENEAACLDLMLEGLRLTDRSVRFKYPWSNFGLHFSWANFLLRGGALTHSRDGVCFIGNIDWFPENLIATIKKALEDEFTLPIEGLQNIKANFKCAIWSVNLRTNAGQLEKKLSQLSKSFGFFWGQEEKEILLNCHNPPVNISSEQLKHYLAAVNNIEVTLRPDAVDLIQSYISASNSLRGDILPVKIVDLLSSLAEANARLNRRTDGMTDDVLLGIQLIEFVINPLRKIPQNCAGFKVWLTENVLNAYY